MPAQTIKKNLYFPDGAKVSIKKAGSGVFLDVGAISTAVNNVYNYDENQFETANAGKTDKQIKNMTIGGDFTLINLEQDGIEALSGGAMELVVNNGTPTGTVEDQVIATGAWTDMSINNLVLDDATVLLKATAVTFTTVTADTSGVLAVNDDYFLIADTNSPSGYSIQFSVNGTATLGLGETITLDYNSVTPIDSSTLYGGSSTDVLSAYAMKITHTDDNNKIRELELFSVDSNAGGFAFNFKGANEDGVEEMPISYTAKIDTTRVNKRQLFAWTIEAGAQ